MKIIGSVGRLSDVKNHIQVVRALQHISDVFYIIVGQGPLKSHLFNEAKLLNVQNRLMIIDELKHSAIIDFLNRLSLFIFPSLSEAFGLAVVEAASVGLPIVTIDVPWVNDTLGNVCLKSQNNPQDIALNIKQIFKNNSLYETLKEKSLCLSKKYSFNTMAEIYLKEIKTILS
jgi:glycosyltransferase involved in cell wall biosynthesis